MRRWLLAALFLPACTYADPSPSLAAAASAIIPGLGQAAQGDYTTAAEHFGLFAVSLGLGLHYQNQPDFLKDEDRYQHEREIINQTTLRRDFALRVATDTALYSSFAAYRDGRSRDTRYYRTPAPKVFRLNLSREVSTTRFKPIPYSRPGSISSVSSTPWE